MTLDSGLLFLGPPWSCIRRSQRCWCFAWAAYRMSSWL